MRFHFYRCLAMAAALLLAAPGCASGTKEETPSTADTTNDNRGTPGDLSTEDIVAEDLSPSDLWPDDVSPVDITPDEVALKDVSADEVALEDVSPDEVAPEDVSPDEVSLEDLSPDEVSPEDLSPEDALPDTLPDVEPEEVVCEPDCAGKDCGDDGCGGSCGECEEHYECQDGGCLYQPWCGDGSCDTDLGESCATCPADCLCGANALCIGGEGTGCVCAPGYAGDGVTCTDPDGCMGDPCPEPATCTDLAAPAFGYACHCPEAFAWDGAAGGCVAVSAGGSCATAILLGELPIAISEDTTGAGDDFQVLPGHCPGMDYPAGAADDLVFELVPEQSGVFLVRVEPDASYDPILSVRATCDDGASCMAYMDDGGLGEEEELLLELTESEPVFIVVDGFKKADSATGPFTLVVEAGIDECAAGTDDCDPAATCEDTFEGYACTCNPGWTGDGQTCTPNTTPGDACHAPFVVDALPFAFSGKNSDAANDYKTTEGLCPGMEAAVGGAVKDEVFLFTPTTDGLVAFTVTTTVPSLDLVLYLLTDCAGPACVAGVNETGNAQPETLYVDLAAGQDYYLVVDGASNQWSFAGAYTLTIEAGTDECAAEVGPCDPNASCVDTPGGYECTCLDGYEGDGQTCVANPDVGDTCALPIEVTLPLPFVWAENTAGAINHYGVESGQCPGQSGAVGGASPDHAYRFVPDETGPYLVQLFPGEGYDGALYATSDCVAPEACIAISQGSYDDGDESLYLPLQAGVPVFFIVDGGSSWMEKSGSYKISVSAGTDECAEGTDDCAPDALCADTVDGFTCECPLGMVGDGKDCAPVPDGGDSCGEPVVIDSLPWGYSGTTTGASNALSAPAGACPGWPDGFGASTPDHVFQLTPLVEGPYLFQVEPVDPFDTSLYLLEDCWDSTQCIAADEVGGGGQGELLYVHLEAGVTYHLVVDGSSNVWLELGAYTLTVEKSTDECAEGIADCDPDATCTDTLEGFDCTCFHGYLGDGKSCTPAPTGDTCPFPFPVEGLPYAGAGDTTNADNDYAIPAGACPGQPAAEGAGSPDHAYGFTPTSSGPHKITLTPDGTFDSVVYVVTQCLAPIQCVGASDAPGAGSVDVLTVNLTEGIPYFIIVDGWENVNEESGTYTISVTGP